MRTNIGHAAAKTCSMIADRILGCPRCQSLHVFHGRLVGVQGSLGGVRVLAALGGRLFGGLFRRADAIAAAMTARGFVGMLAEALHPRLQLSMLVRGAQPPLTFKTCMTMPVLTQIR